MDSLLWNALLNVESHRERVRFRVETMEALERLHATARLYAERLQAKPSDVAWNQTLARFRGERRPRLPRRTLALDAWVRDR